MADDTAARCVSLTRRFGSRVAVDAVSLTVAVGESVAVIGPNGAGKTTLMRMIGCLTRPTSGTLRVLGLDPARHAGAIRHRLGVMHQHNPLDHELSVRDNVSLYGGYFGMSSAAARARADELLELVRLSPRAGSAVRQLSGGMARRLGIARALVSSPDLLLLDEPTVGLDPRSRHRLWAGLRSLRDEGATLILTTHYMHEVEQLCDRVVLMAAGRVIVTGSPSELVTRYCGREVITAHVAAGTRPDPGTLHGIGESVSVLPNRVVVHTNDVRASLKALSDRLTPESVHIRRADLEDAYLRATGVSLAGDAV